MGSREGLALLFGFPESVSGRDVLHDVKCTKAAWKR